MRVVHVITRLLQAGAEENTVATCLYQVKKGWDVTLVHGPDFYPGWYDRIDKRVRMVQLDELHHPISPTHDAKAIFALSRLFTHYLADVVHTHQSKAGIVGRAAAALAGVPTVAHTVHIAPFVNTTGFRRVFYLTAERLCGGMTDLLIPVSEGMHQACLAAGIATPERYRVVHSGMPIGRFVTAEPPEDWRRRIGGWTEKTKPQVLLMLAAFVPRKRHQECIEALAVGLKARPNLLLLLGGEGSQRQSCEELVHALGLDEQVRFLGHDPAPQELVALSDLCLLTSKREGLPRVAVQYIAAGKPIAICDLPGIDELVRDGVNGKILPANNFAEVAQQLFALLDDHEGLAGLATGARATDVSRWDEALMGERIEQAYQETIARQHRDRREVICSIEFFGLPGTGKTTVAQELVALLQKEGRATSFSRTVMADDRPMVVRSMQRLRRLIVELARQPREMFRRAKLLASQESGTTDRLKTIWNYWCVLAMVEHHQRTRPRMLLLDQGLVQAIWTARLHEQSTGNSEEWMRLVRGPWMSHTLFVKIAAPSRIAAERLTLRKRKTSRMQRSDCIANEALWTKGEALIGELNSLIDAELQRHLLQSHHIEISSVDGQSPQQLAEMILAYLKLIESAAPVAAVQDVRSQEVEPLWRPAI